MQDTIDIHSCDNDTLGGRIARARDLSGMSVDEIAARVGVTAGTFAEWESDRNEPRSNKIATLAGVLGVSPTWLLSGVGDGPDVTSMQMGLAEMRSELNRMTSLKDELSAGIETLRTKIDTMILATGQ